MEQKTHLEIAREIAFRHCENSSEANDCQSDIMDALAQAESRVRAELKEKGEALRKVERYTEAAYIVVDEKNINFNLGVDAVLALLSRTEK